MEEFSRIGHFNFIRGLEDIHIGKNSSIGRFNRITGHPLNSVSLSFKDEFNRNPSLIVKNESAITNNHLLDCTNKIHVGSFSILAGYNSQLLTHSIDLSNSVQKSDEIFIGDFCFIGTSTIILPGSSIPSFSIVGASSLVKEKLEKSYMLYAGVPAKAKKSIDTNISFFNRDRGYVI